MLQEKSVVTCFLEADGEILILRRSDRVGSYRGCWAGVSGYIETTADEQALTELAEEAGLSPQDLTLVKIGEPLVIDHEELDVRWMVHPYLFRIADRSKVRTDWEHQEMRWIKPGDIVDYETVPHLRETLDAVLT